jgi:hypothetical protein
VITEARKVKVFSPSDLHPMEKGTRPLGRLQNMWKSGSKGAHGPNTHSAACRKGEEKNDREEHARQEQKHQLAQVVKSHV